MNLGKAGLAPAFLFGPRRRRKINAPLSTDHRFTPAVTAFYSNAV